MAIPIQDSFRVSSNVPLDIKSVFDTKTNALTGVPSAERYVGLLIYIRNEKKLYTFKDGITDAELVPLADGSGLTQEQEDLLDALELDDEGKLPVGVIPDSVICTYDNDGTGITVGGIPAGTVFDGATIPEVLNQLLNPYQKPVISITASPAGPFSMDDASQTIALNVNYTKKSLPLSGDLTFSGLYTGTEPAVPEGGTTQKSNITVTNTGTATVSCTDGQQTSTASATVNFYFPFITGLVSGTRPTTIAELATLTKLVKAKSNTTQTFNGSGYSVLAYPASYGALGIIRDNNGFDVTGSFDVFEDSYDNGVRPAELYKVYVHKNNASYTSAAYQFNF